MLRNAESMEILHDLKYDTNLMQMSKWCTNVDVVGDTGYMVAAKAENKREV